jgi:hypothetical protein
MTKTQYKCIFLVSSMITPTIQKFFTPEERFQQTIKTAESIRKYCENSYCILIEGSVLNKEKCDILQSYFDIILNYGNTPDIIPFVSNINVGCGEQKLLEKGIEYIEEYLFDKIETEYIIKLGGRYELNNNFDINKFDKNKYNFYEEFDNNGNSLNVYTTGLYSIPVYDISFFKNKLKEAADFLYNNHNMIEKFFFDNINKDKVRKHNILGLSGRLNYNGHFFEK